MANAFQLVIMASIAFMCEAGTGSKMNALKAYVLYNNRSLMFEVIGRCEQWYALQLQHTFCSVSARIVCMVNAGDGVVALEAAERSEAAVRA